ncbi:MAG: hypothetical protein LIO93_01870, partial [Bacteroidales bacterium]|nr:hypothetical protein [Bacteroidales bacterium]
MKKLYVLCTLLLVCCAIFSQNLKPVQTQVGKLHISVDPRIELLSVVQNFSTYPLINRSIE